MPPKTSKSANLAAVEEHSPAATPGSAVKMLFPFLDLKAQFATIRHEIMAAVEQVMESQQFILGPEVEALEAEVAAYVGTRLAVGCASGSDALLLALLAWGVGPGDEVIAPPFTFVATAGAVARTGAKPVFVDIEPQTFNMDPKLAETAITARTRAIIPVHLFGLSADLTPMLKLAERHGLAVVEDAAQAIGARYQDRRAGSLGTFGCFSFFPSKNLAGAGDGGLITTNDPALADKLRLLRAHGSRQKYEYEILGTNSRLDALQAAILRTKLKHLDEWAQKRRTNAERYRSGFAEWKIADRVTLPTEPNGYFHVYNQFTIRCPERDRLRDFLRGRGIPTEIYYPKPLHLQPAFEYLGCKQGQFPHSEAASREVLSLPISPDLSEQQQLAVVHAIGEFYGATR